MSPSDWPRQDRRITIARTPPTFSFGREKRIRTQAQFQAVYGKRVSRHAGPLRVYALPNDVGYHRLGLSVSKRVGNAVVRNHIKRMLRESFRLLQHELPGNYDLVIVVHRHAPVHLTRYQQWLTNAVNQLDQHWQEEGTTA